MAIQAAPPPDNEDDDPNADAPDANAAPAPANANAPPAAPGPGAPANDAPASNGMMASNDTGTNLPIGQLKKLYQRFVLNGHTLIYSQAAFQTIVQKLRLGAQQDPVGTLANIVVMIVMRLQSDSGQLPQQLVLKAATEFIDELAQISAQAKAHVFTDQEKQGALYRAVDQYRVIMAKQGKTDPAAAQQQMGQLKQAENNGTLDKIAPGLASHFAGMAKKHMVPSPANANTPAPAQQQAPGPAAPAQAMPQRGRGMMVGG